MPRKRGNSNRVDASADGINISKMKGVPAVAGTPGPARWILVGIPCLWTAGGDPTTAHQRQLRRDESLASTGDTRVAPRSAQRQRSAALLGSLVYSNGRDRAVPTTSSNQI